MKLITLTEIADLTGKAWRTVKKVVASAGIDPIKRTPRADLYDSEAVLRALYERPTTIDGDEALGLGQEKARQHKEAADKLAMENAVRRGELADTTEVERFWTDCIANARARALALPAKLSPRLVNIGDANVISAAIRAEVYAFLSELADYDPDGGGEPERRDPPDIEGLDAAAKPDRELVGRPRAKAQQRKQRGARPVAD